MQWTTYYSLQKKGAVCINILPVTFRLLTELGNGNPEEVLHKLLEKFKSKILARSNVAEKKTATADYQPKHEGYIKRKIKLSPSLWQKFWELRILTGYSISYIIRMFIEWELEEQENSREKNNSIIINSVLIISPERSRNNYLVVRMWIGEENTTKIFYWDDS